MTAREMTGAELAKELQIAADGCDSVGEDLAANYVREAARRLARPADKELTALEVVHRALMEKAAR